MTYPIKMTIYRWGGESGPFKVKIPCGECTLTKDIIQGTVDNELKDYDVEVETFDWLSNWWKPLLRDGWHAPIVMVNGTIIGQGEALNRGVLTQALSEAGVAQKPVKGTVASGEQSCPFCVKAKEMLDELAFAYDDQDVVAQPNALYEMLGRVKPIVGPKTPVTVPQIWIDGQYVGGAQELEAMMQQSGFADCSEGLRLVS